MRHPLAGSRDKSKWALEHLKTLNQELKVFYESQPYDFEDTFNPDTGEYRLSAKKITPAKPEWPLMIGDILQNLRASLDYVIWQMAIADGNMPPPFPLPKRSPWKHLQFPIFLDKNDFQNNRDRYLWGIRDSAARFVERQQPFDMPSSPLWWLGELSNIDKHRMLTVTRAYLHNVRIPHPPGTQIVTHFLHPLGFFEDNAEIMHITIVPPKSPVKVEERGLQLMMVFGPGMAPAEGEGVITALGKMGFAVEKILEGTQPFVRPRS